MGMFRQLSAARDNAALTDAVLDGFFDEHGYARSILVDSEPKVVSQADSLRHRFPDVRRSNANPSARVFRARNIVYEQSGRGSNWAYGYYNKALKRNTQCGRGSSEQKSFSTAFDADRPSWEMLAEDSSTLADKAMDCFRRELEQCDAFSAALLVHSVSGGTGSGVHVVVSFILRVPFFFFRSCVSIRGNPGPAFCG